MPQNDENINSVPVSQSEINLWLYLSFICNIHRQACVCYGPNLQSCWSSRSMSRSGEVLLNLYFPQRRSHLQCPALKATAQDGRSRCPSHSCGHPHSPTRPSQIPGTDPLPPPSGRDRSGMSLRGDGSRTPVCAGTDGLR